MRQLIVESVLLSIAGGIVGVLLAVALTQTLLAQAPETIAHIEIGSAPTLAVAFGLGVALVAGLAFGFATAAPFGRPDLEGVLRESSRGASAGRRQLRLRNVLVIGQVALALVLVIGAALLLRSFQRLSSVSLGILSEKVLTFQVHLPAGRYAEAQRRADFHLELQRRRLTPGLLDAIRRELAAIDPALVLHRPTPLSDVIAGGVALDRFATLVVGVYALLAVSLAAVGIYGVLSYAVSRRQRELGIRLALGAPANSIRSLVVRDGGRLAAIGVVLGLAAAALTTRVLGSMLFEVSVMDPWVFGLAAAALASVALAASWIPARTAAKVDPLHSLRADG